ncbi:hypothetical protein [Bacillus tequilensis]|uniref:hypothetical protein n=1 Tax=Bacillus tequilensis TaxID=227866 RepID=UPI0020C6E28D|nr:hypothetical protein [Bacillus tequilensis]
MANPINAALNAIKYIRNKYGNTSVSTKPYTGYVTPIAITTPNLLTIELTDEQSIPRIVYKGEEITGRIAVDFEWRTKDADRFGSTYYRIKHTKDSTGAPVVETKELAVGERAYG